jgi:hypothetical protein
MKFKLKNAPLIVAITLICSLISFNAYCKDVVTYQNGALSIDVVNMPLGSILSKIQAKTGIEFVLNEKEAARNISACFDKMELEKAIKRLLGRSNRAVIYASNGNIEKVEIHSSGTSVSNLKYSVETPEVVKPKTIASQSEGDKNENPRESETMVLSAPTKEMEVIPASELNAMLTEPPTRDMQVTPVDGSGVMVLSPGGSSMNTM